MLIEMTKIIKLANNVSLFSFFTNVYSQIIMSFKVWERIFNI